MSDKDETIIDFKEQGAKYRHARDHRKKEEKVDDIKRRFEALFPDKPRPVKDYLNKKRSKKKRH